MLIKNAKLVDVLEDQILDTDIRIEDGKVVEIEKNLKEKTQEKVLDVHGLYVSPGFVDSHTHLRDPGLTDREDLDTGQVAAARGGYTSLVCMANTIPAMDTKENVEAFYTRAKNKDINIYTVGNFTMSMADEELTNMKDLKSGGVIGISDDGRPNMDTGLLYKGLMMAKNQGLTVAFHEEDPNLVFNPGINHAKAKEFGKKGAMSLAEDVLVAREGAMALETGADILIQHLSSKNSVKIIRAFKNLGASIHAEVCPHHFTSTQDLIDTKGTLAKMNPPLRTEEDRLELIEGLKDGTIEIIATDHAPHLKADKEKDFDQAPSGIIGLETSFGLGITNLVRPGHLSLVEFIKKISINPSRILKLDKGSIKVGKSADLAIFDLDESWEVEDFYSKSSNSPYLGEILYGKIKYTICKGKIVYEDGRD